MTFLREHEYDSEAEAERRLEWLYESRKCDLEIERPVKLFDTEDFEMECLIEDESDFVKPMSPTGFSYYFRPLPEKKELRLEELTEGDPDFEILDDISVATELSGMPSKKCKVGQHESPVKKVRRLRQSKRVRGPVRSVKKKEKKKDHDLPNVKMTDSPKQSTY